MLRLTYLACDFNTVDTNEGHSFDEGSFIRYLNDPLTQKKIKGKTLLGAISHKCRTDFESYMHENRGNCSVGNPGDYLLANDSAANTIVDAVIKDHKLFITIETLPTKDGIRLERMLDLGMDLKVSMSTELEVVGDKYKIINLFGLDHTISPAFKTDLVSMKRVGGTDENI